MTLTRCLRFLGLAVLLAALPVLAATRTLSILAPDSAKPGANVEVVVAATTDSQDAEHIGFLHAEFSVDGGKTWVPVYRDNLGRNASQPFNLTTGGPGTKVLLRVRAAFRGGKAGDVDYLGAPIAWDQSWDKWGAPPARHKVITVTAR